MKPEHLEELDELLADQPAFTYSLDRVCWFGKRVLWLAPHPAEPFKQLTARVAAHFDTPPWQGEFAEVVPHLTVGLASDALGARWRKQPETLPPNCLCLAGPGKWT